MKKPPEAAGALPPNYIIQGYPVRYDANSPHIAHARGLWPLKSIVVGPNFSRLPHGEQQAVLLHEVHHCRAGHLEQRVVVLLLLCAPSVALLPWPTVLAIVLTLLACAFAEWHSHKNEFDADAYAAREHGEDFVHFLRRCVGPQSIFHPSTDERIARVEKLTAERKPQ